MSEEPTLTFASASEWRAWLEEHHAAPAGVWLKIAKKGRGIETVTHAEALEEALCFGWIDAVRHAHDEDYFLQRFVPRRPKSKWSQVNRDKVLALTEAGRMHPSGLAQVERAKADGRWDAAYAPQSQATVPDDLQAELDARPKAKATFATLKSQNRYAILYRLRDAKRPETRARRLQQFVEMLERGETPYPR